MSTQIERLIVEMQAKLDKYDRDIKSSMDKTKRESGKGQKALQSVEKQAVSLNSIGSTAIKAFGAAAAVYFSAATIRALGEYADAYTSIENKLKTVLKPTEDLAKTTEKLLGIANDTRSSLDSTATLYSRLTRNTKELGLSQNELFQITETINKSFAVSGATVAEAGAAIVQLSQGLASGALRGDEFNSVAEQAPVIMEAVAAQLKVTRGELREMAADGKISAKVLIDSLKNYKETIDSDFGSGAATISQSTTALKDNFTVFVGKMDDATDSSGMLSTGINGLAKAFKDLSDNVPTEDDLGPVDEAMLRIGASINITLVALEALYRTTGLTKLADGIAPAVLAYEEFQATLKAAMSDAQNLDQANIEAADALNIVSRAMGTVGGRASHVSDGYKDATQKIKEMIAATNEDPSIDGLRAIQGSLSGLIQDVKVLNDDPLMMVDLDAQVRGLETLTEKLDGLIGVNLSTEGPLLVRIEPEVEGLEGAGERLLSKLLPGAEAIEAQTEIFKEQFAEIMGGVKLESNTGFRIFDPEKLAENKEKTLSIIEEVLDVRLAQEAEFKEMLTDAAAEQYEREQKSADQKIEEAERAADGVIAANKKATSAELKAELLKTREQSKLERENQKNRSATFQLVGILGKKGQALQNAYFLAERAYGAASIVVDAAKGGQKAIGQMGPAGIPVAAGIIAAGVSLAASTSSVTAGDTSISASIPSATITQIEAPETASFDTRVSTEDGAQSGGVNFIAQPGGNLEPLFELFQEAIKTGHIEIT